MKSHLIFLGAPGSGKGTQANRLVEREGYKHISTGNLLRSEIAKKTQLGNEVKSVLDEGSLVSDDLVIKLLKANLTRDESYIYDGFPRNINQAIILDDQVLKGLPNKVVYFEIDLKALLQRLTNRITCSDCGSIFNLLTKKPKLEGKCDHCGSQNLIQRPDDKKEVVENRLKVFEETILPLLEYYENSGRLIRVNAEEQEDKIFNQILSKI